MKTIERKLTVGYVRSAVKDDVSVKKQEEQINEYCLENGVKLSKVFIDNGCSGANINRPALQELLVEIAKKKISKIVSVDSSRLSRNLLEYTTLKSLLTKHGAEIIFISDKNANNDPYLKSFEEIVAVINSFQPRTHRDEPKEQPISVDKQNRFKRHVKISVSEKDLNNTSKFKEMLKDESFDGCTCGLYRSQIVLIAKILRLNLDNTTEVKAEFRF